MNSVSFEQHLNNWLRWEEIKIKNKEGVVVLRHCIKVPASTKLKAINI